MGDDLKSATKGLAEQTKKLDIATYYTHNDFELAKKMVTGSYKDLYVLKINFTSSSVYGAIIVFYNHILNYIVHLHGIVSKSFSIQDIKPSAKWKIFEKDIVDIVKKNEHDSVLTNQSLDSFSKGFTVQIGNEIKKFLENDDSIQLVYILQKLAQDTLGFQNVKVLSDYEEISSVDMELFSLSSKKINLKKIQAKEKQENEAKENPQDKNSLNGKAVKLLLQAALVLSPIKGLSISELKVNDRIKIKLIDKNPKAKSVLTAFKAIDEEGNQKPIPARIISIDYSKSDGYKINAIIAKGIFAEIYEEEENIKVLMADGYIFKTSSQKKNNSSGGISMPLLIGLIVFVVAVVAGVVVFLSS